MHNGSSPAVLLDDLGREVDKPAAGLSWKDIGDSVWWSIGEEYQWRLSLIAVYKIYLIDWIFQISDFSGRTY